MNAPTRVLSLFIFLFVILLATGHYARAEELDIPSPAPDFSMDDSLRMNGHGLGLNLGQLGNMTISPVVTGFGVSQTNSKSNDTASAADISNAQLLFQKNTGTVQFFVQTGIYSIYELGAPYQHANTYTTNTFGYVPQAYVSFVPDANWSISAGKLSAMGGYEANFSYQNLNIERGLLWGQTNSISMGMQVNHTEGDLSMAFTWNDGSYSGKYNWLGATLSYQAGEAHTLTASWVGAISPNDKDTVTTPLLQNNSQVFNLIYKYDKERWMVVPYLQYTVIAANPSIGIQDAHQTYGAALLMNYRLQSSSSSDQVASRVSLPVRFEYLRTSGGSSPGEPTLLFGPDSSAWSITVTPTYQFDQYFLRLETSYVRALNAQPEMAFGPTGMKNSQVRVMAEIGLLF